MSDSKKPRPSKLWGFALSLLACAVALWIMVKVLESTWGWLLIIAGVIALVTTAVLVFRWSWQRNRW
jgi:cytochrome c biogenesis protein CcdA